MTKKERENNIIIHSKNAEVYIRTRGMKWYEAAFGIRLSPVDAEDIHSEMVRAIILRLDKTDGFGEISMKVAFMRALQVLNLQPKRGSGHLIMMTDHFEDFGMTGEDGEQQPFELSESIDSDSTFDAVWDKLLTPKIAEIEAAMEEKRLSYKNPASFKGREKIAWLKRTYPEVYDLMFSAT
jgi:hypothetical protein